jgi:hypothetical protein
MSEVGTIVGKERRTSKILGAEGTFPMPLRQEMVCRTHPFQPKLRLRARARRDVPGRASRHGRRARARLWRAAHEARRHLSSAARMAKKSVFPPPCRLRVPQQDGAPLLQLPVASFVPAPTRRRRRLKGCLWPLQGSRFPGHGAQHCGSRSYRLQPAEPAQGLFPELRRSIRGGSAGASHRLPCRSRRSQRRKRRQRLRSPALCDSMLHFGRQRGRPPLYPRPHEVDVERQGVLALRPSPHDPMRATARLLPALSCRVHSRHRPPSIG